MVLGYIYALKKMAEAEKKGSISFNEIAGHLKMSTQQLKGLLEIMERMGHIEKITEKSPDLSSSCPGSCKNCGCCGGSEKITVSSGMVYRLTDKGRRVCRNRTEGA